MVYIRGHLISILQGTAELLPRDRTTLAGWLRVGSFLLALLSLTVAFTRLATL